MGRPRRADAVDDVAAQDAEVGDHEVGGLAEDPPVDGTDQRAAEAAVAGRLLALELAEDHVLAGHGLVDEEQRLVRRVLQVVVHRDDVVAARGAQPGQVGVVLSVVLEQVERHHVRRRARLLRDDVPAAVGAAVVDEDDFVTESVVGEHLDDSVDRRPHQLLAVVDGDHDRVGELGPIQGLGTGLCGHGDHPCTGRAGRRRALRKVSRTDSGASRRTNQIHVGALPTLW
jgi:hypothetical protein